MGRKNDVETVDQIIGVLIKLSADRAEKGLALTRSIVSRELTKLDLLMQNSTYNKKRSRDNDDLFSVTSEKSITSEKSLSDTESSNVKKKKKVKTDKKTKKVRKKRKVPDDE